MSNSKVRRIVLALASATAMLVAAPLVSAQSGAELPRTHGFSGAYLASRTAIADRDLGAAIHYLEEALRYDPENIDLKRDLMLSLVAVGQFDKSLEWAEQLKTVPELERYSRLALAVDAARKREYNKASILLMLSDQNDLDRLVTGILSAWTKAGDNDAAGAIESIEAMKGPEWYGVFKNVHRALIADFAKDAPRAKAFYQAMYDDRYSAESAPDAWARGVESYASFLARTGDKEAALEAIRNAGADVRGQIVVEALQADIEAGKPTVPLIRSPQEGMAEMLLHLAVAIARPGAEDSVVYYLELARALDPENARILVELGQMADRLDDHERAVEFYAMVPEGDALKRAAELQLGLALSDLERNDEAKEHLAALVESDPDDRTAYLALGGVHASLEEYREAADVYDRAVARIGEPSKDDWNIYYQRGIAYERLKEWEKAEPNFRKALDLSPDQPQVLNYLGYSWVDMKLNLEEGLDLIRKAVGLRPQDGYIVDSLGWAYYRLGRFEEAVAELEKAVRLRPEDPTIVDHLGDAYWQVGRKREAVFKWRAALGLDPDETIKPQIEAKLRDGLAAPEEEAKPVEKKAEDVETTKSVTVAGNGVAAPSSIVVRPGQSLWEIAAEYLGDGNRYLELLEANPALRGNPDELVPGQEIRLPAPAR